MATTRIGNYLRVVRGAGLRAQQPRRAFVTYPTRLAAQGDAAAETPQDPPDVGKGSGAAPTKAAFSESMNKAADKESPGSSSASSGGSRSKEASETGSSPTGGEIADKAQRKGGEALKGPKGKNSPQPTLFSQAIPGTESGLSEEQKKEVEQHNSEFEERHDRAAPAADDKVDKKFWKGSNARTGTETDWNA